MKKIKDLTNTESHHGAHYSSDIPTVVEQNNHRNGTDVEPQQVAATGGHVVDTVKNIEKIFSILETAARPLSVEAHQIVLDAAKTLSSLGKEKLIRRALALLNKFTSLRCDVTVLDVLDDGTIRGKIVDKLVPNQSLTVDLVDGEAIIAQSSEASASNANEFVVEVPDHYCDGNLHTFDLRVVEMGGIVDTIHIVVPAKGDASASHMFLDRASWHEVSPIVASATTAVEKSALEQRIDALCAELSELDDDQLEERAANLSRQGRLALNELSYDLAVEKFTAAIEAAPATDAIEGYVHAVLGQGNLALAQAVVADALQRDPDNSSFHALADKIESMTRPKQARTVAFYLPQFHPTEENNKWWGRGFTEWTNVAAATPLFEEHLQPRRPTALGYYDLRLAEAANAQFDLAKQYGIDGFCYYYYWFDGRRILSRPLQDLVDGKTGPFPFCICWANEDWTRSWDGSSGEVLMAQNHTPESDLRFISDVAELLRHPDYIRVDGKPILVIYRADKLATPLATANAWRKWCRENGIGEIHLCAVQSFGFGDPRPFGFDAAVEFPPHCAWMQHPNLQFHRELPAPSTLVPGFSGKLYDYETFADAAIARPREPYTLHRTCMVAWDNTARRQKTAHVFHNFSVKKFEQWHRTNAVKASIEQTDPLVFINAWNEWAEGSVMEPDDRFGFEILETVRRANRDVAYSALQSYWRASKPIFPEDRVEARERVLLFGHDAFPAGAQKNLLNMARTLKRQLDTDVVIFLLSGGPLLPEYERVAPTTVIGNEAGWEDRLTSQLRRFAALGTSKAICNTVATGTVVEILKRENFRVISLIHELPSLIERHNLQHHCWNVAVHADALVFANEVVANEYADRYWPDQKKILIAPQGITFNPHHSRRDAIRAEVRAHFGLEKDCLLVIGCGYGDRRKGIDLFVQMAGEVARKFDHGKVGFIWVGDIEPDLVSYIESDIERLKLEELLHVTGFTDDPGRIFIAAEVFTLTSREDPFPSVVLEAFDSFLPVVAFDGAGGFVAVVNQDTGALVPYLGVGAMADAVSHYLADDRHRTTVGSKNHALARQQFSYAPYMRKLLALLAEVPAASVQSGSLTRTAWRGIRSAPTVSVILPNYNYGRYLELRLRSILDQTLQPTEVIVLDDASDDFSVEIIEKIARNSIIPIKLVKNKKNSGNTFAQWAKGLKLASGDLIWIAEADDYCEPTLLETLANEFQDKSVVMSWADSIMVDAEGRGHEAQYKSYYARSFGEAWNTHFRMAGPELIERYLAVENVVPNASAVLFKRSAVTVDDLKLIQDYKFSGDWWFWLKIASQGKVVYRAEPLNYHRRHAKSVMGDVLRKGASLLPETIQFYKRVLHLMESGLPMSTRMSMLERLERLYNSFPELVSAYPRLGEHQDFEEDYKSLLECMRLTGPGQLSACKPTALLAISNENEEMNDVRRGVLATLAASYDLTVALVGPVETSEVLRELSGELHFDTCTFKSWTASPAAYDEIYSIGLAAHCALATVESKNWTIIGGVEFDSLLGRLSSNRSVTVSQLKRAFAACCNVQYTSDVVPHALGRLSQEFLCPIEKFVFTNSSAKQCGAISAAMLRYVAIPAPADAETWKEVANTLAQVSDETGSQRVLRLLARGDMFMQLKREFDEFSNVEVVALYHKPLNFRSVGDIALEIASPSKNLIDSWIMKRTGMKIVQLTEPKSQGRGKRAKRDFYSCLMN